MQNNSGSKSSMSMSSMDGNMNMNHDGMSGMNNNDMMNMNMNGSMAMMKMYFNTDLPVYLVFQPFHVKTGLQMLGACFAIFILAFLYEGLKNLGGCRRRPGKMFREFLLRTRSNNCHDNTYDGTQSALPANGDNDINNSMTTHVFRPRLRRTSWFDKWHIMQSGLHMVQVFLSYILMLLFMTYNVYVCLAVVIGAGFGYFAFSRNRASIIDINEHCH